MTGKARADRPMNGAAPMRRCTPTVQTRRVEKRFARTGGAIGGLRGF